MKHALRTAAVVAVTALALTGCGSSNPGDDAGSTNPAVPDSAAFNDADVAFTTEMVQHHAQALAMVDLTTQRELDPEFAALAEQIRAAQAPEIETMVDWLQDWDQPVPATVNDHANADGHDSSTDPEGMGASGDMGAMGGDMPGMMSAEEMTALEDAPDADFEDEWLQSMVRHHEGAVTMAQTEIADGEDADAIALATSIVDSQGDEIDQMKAMLAG